MPKLTNEAPFAFAGIWDVWNNGTSSTTSVAIITTTANDLLAPLHDRRPVILSENAQEQWLRHPAEVSELRWACEDVGIQDLTFHDFRHTWSTRAAELG